MTIAYVNKDGEEPLKKLMAVIIIGILFLPIFITSVHAYGSILTVGNGGTYSTIQTAIDAANPGDIVEVATGTYTENIFINKGLTLAGQTDQSAIIDGNGIGNTVTITGIGVNVNGFTITNSGSQGSYTAGIYLDSSATRSLISDNIVAQNPATDGAGITLYESGNNKIVNNSIVNNAGAGIYLAGASYNVVANNIIANNQGDNILSDLAETNTCVNNTIVGNTVRDGGGFGMLLNYVSPIWIEQNTVTRNAKSGIETNNAETAVIMKNAISNNMGIGVSAASSSYVGVGDNIIRNNIDDGVYVFSSSPVDVFANIIDSNDNGVNLLQSDNANIAHNNITNNNNGVKIIGSSSVEIIDNRITNSRVDGINLAGTGCLIYNNHFISNYVQAVVNSASTGNAWDDGYPTGGNYWSDYTGIDQFNGPSQNTPGSDGIGDTHYTVNLATGDIDNFPILDPYATATQSVNGQSVSIDQTQITGVDLTLQGPSLQDATVTATTVNFGTTPPTKGPNPLISAGPDATYYDVKVTSDTGHPLGSDVTVTVLLTDPTFTSSSSMVYWDGTNWIPVASTFIAPHTISGNILASALAGTPISVFSTHTTQYYLRVSSAQGSPLPSAGWFDAGTQIVASVISPVAGDAGTQYVCTGWSGTGSVPASGAASSATFTITAPSTIQWNWKTQYQVSFTVSPPATGTVNPTKTVYYNADSTFPISATANSGYTFWGWSSSNPSITFLNNFAVSTTVTVNGPGVIAATFALHVNGNEHITLSGSNNVVIITGGNDIIDATKATATTVIKTGAGNDIINLGGGNNIVKETATGNDIITTGNGDNTITITGNGNYQITTGIGNDQIQITGNGNNIINAGNGNNVVTVSGKGNNQISTGSGNDVVAAGDGNNIIKSGDGNNKVTAGKGNNQITTGSGNDAVTAGNGNNNIQTEAGNDNITVGNGNNYIDGGPGYDVCIHGTGHNTILNCEKT